MLVLSKLIKKFEIGHSKDAVPSGIRAHDPCVEFDYENYRLNRQCHFPLLSMRAMLLLESDSSRNTCLLQLFTFLQVIDTFKKIKCRKTVETAKTDSKMK